MTHITIASTLLTQPLAINGRTTSIPTNTLEPLAPHAAALQVEPDDICATLSDAGVSFTRVQLGDPETLGAASGDLGGGAGPGGLSAPPITLVDPGSSAPPIPVDQLAGGDSEGLTLAEQGITGPANQIPGPEIVGETDPLIPPASFPASPPAPPHDPKACPEPSLLDQSVAKLTEALQNISDVELIDALIVDETNGKTRTSALDALAARKAEIEAQS